MNNIKFSIINSNLTTPTPEEIEVNNKDYVLFGSDNKYPEVLLNCYNDCGILSSIINSITDYVSAGGTDIEDFAVNKDETLNELIKKITLDYIIFGAFTIQLLRNKKGEICEIHYVDVNKCRLSKDNKFVYYSSKGWDRYTRNVAKYDRFNKNLNSNNSIMYYKNAKSSRTTYALPIWNSALKDILTLIDITNFHYSSLNNNFMPSCSISFNNGVPSEEEQEIIEQRIKEKFCGTDNASKFLLSFSDNKDNAPVIERIAYDDFADRYNSLRENAINNIFATFRASEKLFGINETNNGFSTEEFKSIFLLFKTQVIQPIQIEIERAFGQIGIDFMLNEFVIDFEDSDNEVNNDHNKIGF